MKTKNRAWRKHTEDQRDVDQLIMMLRMLGSPIKFTLQDGVNENMWAWAARYKLPSGTTGLVLADFNHCVVHPSFLALLMKLRDRGIAHPRSNVENKRRNYHEKT